MSAVKETLIFCDGGDVGLPCVQSGPYADGDTRSETAELQRRGYRKDGWRYINGKDYCPHCVAKLRLASTGAKT